MAHRARRRRERQARAVGLQPTALHVTTELPGGAIELTRMLLDAGADPNIRDDKYEGTALGWAEFCGQPQIAELLRQRGATT